MACILIATTPVPGHVAPQAEAAGARHVPISHAADWSLIHPHERVPELRDQTGLDQVRTAFRKVFIDSAPGTLATSSGSWSPTMYGVYSRDSAPFGHLYCGLAGPDIAISAAGTSSICARIDRPRVAGPARRWSCVGVRPGRADFAMAANRSISDRQRQMAYHRATTAKLRPARSPDITVFH